MLGSKASPCRSSVISQRRGSDADPDKEDWWHFPMVVLIAPS